MSFFLCFFDVFLLLVCGFFFQAEDGIRDYKVTGVQTCALPISLSAAVKAGVQALGLELYGEDLERAVCVTAVKCPDGIDGDRLTGLIRSKYGIIFAPGQDKLKGKIFRIGHIGYLERP